MDTAAAVENGGGHRNIAQIGFLETATPPVNPYVDDEVLTRPGIG